jgi:hypothetical protein
MIYLKDSSEWTNMYVAYQDDDARIHEMAADELVSYLKQVGSLKYKGFQIDCMGYDPNHGYMFCVQLWEHKGLADFYRALRRTPTKFVLPHGFSRGGFLDYEDGELYFGNTRGDWRLTDLNKKTTKTFKTHAYFVAQAKAFINSFVEWRKGL